MSSFYRLRSGAPPPSYAYKKRRTAGEASTQQQLAQLKRKVNQLKPEVKVAFLTGANSNVTPGVGNITYLSAIAQGVTKQTRLGDQIRCTRLQFRIQCLDVQTAGSGNFGYRVMIVKDKSATGVVPTISGTVSSVLTSGNTLAMPLTSSLDRFTILKDWTFNGAQLATGDISGQFWCDMKMNLVLDYLDASAAQASAGSNSMYVICLTDAATATTDFNWVANLSFTDV